MNEKEVLIPIRGELAELQKARALAQVVGRGEELHVLSPGEQAVIRRALLRSMKGTA